MDNICIPMHLDAFAISPGCCDGESALAPYTQPNYTSLQLDSHLIQHDVLQHVDFHLASPSSRNPRIADISLPPGPTFPWKNLKRSRLGVHLSWSLPRLYRTAQASGKKAKSPDAPNAPNPNLQFRPFPNRWLVVRHLHNFRDRNQLPEWQSWVVESDAVRNLKDIDDSVDLESDVAPFVRYSGNAGDNNILRAQTEVFLGRKFDLLGPRPWAEDDTREHIPKLNLMNSANPVFADNAMHNGNVLSLLDNFAFSGGYLDRAVCDYYVIGWHKDAEDDPFNQSSTSDLATRLSELLLKLDDKYVNDDTVTGSSDKARCLVYGAIHSVTYDFNYEPKNSPTRSLANDAATKFTAQVQMEPLSVGTTPLDAILTFLEAHQADVESIFGAGTKGIASSLMNIAQLLFATGDNYDSRVQAQDLIAQQNFRKTDGGNRWIFGQTTTPGQPSVIPSSEDRKNLRALNENQNAFDATERKLASSRWKLFAEWWKFVTKYVFLQDVSTTESDVRGIVTQLRADIRSLETLRDAINKDISSTSIANKDTCKVTTQEPYHSRIDPTLCIAGLDSGWPSDWNERLTIRLNRDLPNDHNIADAIFAGARNPVTPDRGLDGMARRVLQHCINQSDTDNGTKSAPKITGNVAWADKNPFVPVYIEWEGLYYHVGPMKDKWEVKLRPSPVGHPHPQLRYVPKAPLFKDDKNHKDFRTISGRVMVLPQPVFNLEVLVQSVLDTAGDQITLTETEKDQLKANIGQIQFISAPLSGLTNHLLTRFEGAHVKPSVRKQDERQPTPLTTAVRTAINIDEDALRQIDAESALTPYGDSFVFGRDHYPVPPFKPVTHGQMILTKVNIIDKFGQAVCLPKILRRPRLPPDLPTSNIYPCLSDYLSPDAIDNPDAPSQGKVMNTVLPTPNPVGSGEWPLCQYIQLTPAINQEARINASFLVRDTEGNQFSGWREAIDYDPMVWGWVIINYADNGLQFFLGDGTFYREIRRGGADGLNVSARWLPYDPSPHESLDANEAQLEQLIDKLQKDSDYFQKFCDTINSSIKNMPFPPSAYAQYANSIVGKPLALVNVGWSLELAAPPLESQNTLGLPFADPEAVLTTQYSFALKLGDVARNYDGVVCYWKTDNDAANNRTRWDKVYSYFTVTWQTLPAGQVLQLPPTTTDRYPTYSVRPGDTLDSISAVLAVPVLTLKSLNPSIPDAAPDTDSFIAINESNFLDLNPYYIHPDRVPRGTYQTVKTSRYTVTSMLIDPYTAIHGYSPILPTKALTLSPFAVQTAFAKMHAFFHLGPVLLTTDVPASKTLALVPDPDPAAVVRLPVSGKKGTWTWFQPYERSLDETGPEAAADVLPRYALMGVQEDLGERKFETGPFTFVEGFLQLMGSLKADEKKVATGGGGG